jgi:DNA invertase Pin-like site-specific DNA recombinase
LRDRAVALGWPLERIHVLDCDLGKSGSQSAGRDGFQKLVSEVALGKAGLVMGLEVSRLARNSADWHRLIELCSLAGALILDEDGIYDPANFNDRLLLGLKGHYVGSGTTFPQGADERRSDQQGPARRT